jgi:hypothetical protein
MNVMPFGPGWGQAKRTAVSGPSPVSDLLYQSFYDTLPGAFTFTRASNAWGFNSTGVLTQFANDVSRQVYDPVTLAAQGTLLEPSSTNQVRNPRCEGANVPSTFPTNWSAQVTNGLSASIVGSGSESGIPYLDVHVFGTTTGNATCNLLVETSTGIAALTGQTWTYSPYLRLVGGSFGSPIGGPRLQINEATSSGGFITGGFGPTLALTGAALNTQRYQFTRTLSGGATVACVQPLFTVIYPTGVTVDFTVRIGLPQMEQQDWASSPIMPPVGSPAASTRAADNLTLALPYAGFPGAVGWSVAMEFVPLLIASGASCFSVRGASPSADLSYFVPGSAGGYTIYKVVGGNSVSGSNSSPPITGNLTKFAMAQDNASARASLNGGGITVAANAGYPAMTVMQCSKAASASVNPQAMLLRRLRLWPRALSDAELQAVAA